MRARITVGVLALAFAAFAAAPASAGNGLLAYVTPSPLQLQPRISYEVSCSANCSLTATQQLLIKGPDLKPATVGPGTFGPGVNAVPYLQLPKRAVKELRKNLGKVRLKTTIEATNLDTGVADTISQTFRFKR